MEKRDSYQESNMQEVVKQAIQNNDVRIFKLENTERF